MLEITWHDVLYSLRALRKSWAFALTTVFTLALGIGGNTAIFTVIRAVLLRPLEYRDPDRLVYFSMDDAQRNVRDAPFSLRRFEETRDAARTLAGAGAYGANMENVTLSGGPEPEALKGARVSANFLDILGVQPVLGRGFLKEEGTSGGVPVVMIGTGLWERRFGRDPTVVGKTATLDAIPYTIIGVLPRGFQFPFPGMDVWFTRPSEWSALPSRYWGIPLLKGFGRLAPGASLEQSRAEIDVQSRQYTASHPGADHGTMQVLWLKDRLLENVRPMLWLLFGAVGFVLVIACANVAGLLLARAAERSREFALRAALGAGRGRLIRQVLAESLVLAVAGGTMGALLARWCLSAIKNVSALNMTGTVNTLYLPGAADVRLDSAVFGFTLALSVATGVLFGLFPSLHASRPNLADVLRASGAAAGTGGSGRRGTFGISPRTLLVVAQVALSVVLLVGAALMMQSFVRLHGVDPGFQTANLLTMRIALPQARYDTDRKKTAFFDDLVGRVQTIPGVHGAAVALSLPTTSWIRTNLIQVQGQADPDPNDAGSFAVVQSITPDYFRTLGIPLRRGRFFTDRDNAAGAPPVIMINERLARRLWPAYPRGLDPVGQHIGEGYDKKVGPLEIVGVVADIHEGGLGSDATQELYVPTMIHAPQSAYLAVRTQGDPLRFVNSIRGQVLAIDSDQAVSEVRTMEALYDATLGQRRSTMLLLGLFAGMALLLAVVGIYGMISYSVAQRTQELGVRQALGAQQGDILRLVLWQGLGMTLAGSIVGIAGALALTRVMKGLLFGVSATDPWTFAGTTLLLMVVALAASYLPARRAARIDPMVALRVG